MKQFCTRSLLKFRSLVQNFHRGGRKGRRNFFSMDTTLPNFWRRKMAGCPTATVRSTSSRCRLLPTTAPSCDNLAGSCFPKWRRTRVKARNREKFSRLVARNSAAGALLCPLHRRAAGRAVAAPLHSGWVLTPPIAETRVWPQTRHLGLLPSSPRGR